MNDKETEVAQKFIKNIKLISLKSRLFQDKDAAYLLSAYNFCF